MNGTLTFTGRAELRIRGRPWGRGAGSAWGLGQPRLASAGGALAHLQSARRRPQAVARAAMMRLAGVAAMAAAVPIERPQRTTRSVLSNDGAAQLLCAVAIDSLGCDGWVDADELTRTQVADLCPGPCAEARVASLPPLPPPPLRRLDENATGVEIWCRMAPDRTSFDLLGPTGCMQGVEENFPGEHERRDEKVNAMMLETSAAPLHWVLAYGSTFILTCCSAFCSGLTLGLMGLDMTMIEVVKRSGTPADKARAQKIEPIRKTGNQLLCMLLIGNTAVNAGLAITMADLAGGEWGFVVSTVLILIFGEITPQAICSRYGLAIGAALFWPIQLCMWFFYPLAFPISKILNAVLGKEIGLSYSREELIALLAMHSVGGRTAQGPQGDLSDVEAKILTGVLRFTEKTAVDVCTDVKYVQALGMHEKLDLTVMNCIYRSGHSRIPVYEGDMNNLVGILFVKDLIVVDPEDGVPVKDVVSYFNHNLPMVSKDLGLLSLLDEFIEGHSHMAVVTSASLEALPAILPNSPRISGMGSCRLYQNSFVCYQQLGMWLFNSLHDL